MKNNFWILFVFFSCIYMPIINGQDTLSLKTIFGVIKTNDNDLIGYNYFLDNQDISNLETIGSSIDYFDENLLAKELFIRDVSALLFLDYYLDFKRVYIGVDGNPILSKENNQDLIKSINNNLKELGLILSKMPDDNVFYIVPISGFLTKSFSNKISRSLNEFFLLYDKTIGIWYISQNTANFDAYLMMLEELILSIESYFTHYEPPVNVNYLNRFYIKYLAAYLSLNSEWEIGINHIPGGEEPSLLSIYESFAERNINTVTGKIVLQYCDYLKSTGQILDMSDFFFVYDKNEYGFPEVREDLGLDNIFQELEIFLE